MKILEETWPDLLVYGGKLGSYFWKVKTFFRRGGFSIAHTKIILDTKDYILGSMKKKKN